MSLDLKKFKNILLPRFDTLGDIVLLEGFISALLEYLPEARITLLVRQGYEQMASLFPQRLNWKTTRIVLHKRPADTNEIKSLLTEIAPDSYDLLLTTTFNRTWLDDLLAAAMASCCRIALGSRNIEHKILKEVLPDLDIELPPRLYDEYVQVEKTSHETEKYQILWNKIAAEQKILSRPRLMIPEEENKKANDVLEEANLKTGEFVFCFPAGIANVTYKSWPEEKFAEVLAYIEKTFFRRALIAGHQTEKFIIDKVAKLSGARGANPVVWLGKDGEIPLACALAGKSLFYLGNDTGLMHMAAALDKPVVAVFGGGTWPRFLPVTDKGAVLTQVFPCVSCLWENCWLDNAPCVKNVSSNDVMKAVNTLIEEETPGLEIHKGLPSEKALQSLLGKGYINFKKIFLEQRRIDEELAENKKEIAELHDIYTRAVEEIGKRDEWLSELRGVYADAVEEIGKRDERLLELRGVYADAVEEIGKRDEWLSELRGVYADAVEEIGKRDEWLLELRGVYNQAVAEIEKRDESITELQKSSNELVRANRQAMRFLPLVSIITPVFNGAKWIEACIQSVLNQDYPHIEHIIVDGGSTDSTLEICRRHPHLIIQSKKDRGQSHAINKGFSLARGDIFAWLCADDEYEPGAVQSAVKTIIDGHDVVMGLSRFIDAGGNYIGEHQANVYNYFDNDMLMRFWKYGTISQPAIFWKRKVWEACGPVKENLFFAMDYDLWLRMSKNTAFRRVNAYLAKYRIHADAKCFADNYGSRIELIDVSKNYWPSKWKIKYWRLLLEYYFSNGGNTKHYADAENLLKASVECLNNRRRVKAISTFVAAHFVHFTTPFMPGYRIVLKRIAGEGVGPLWLWRLAKKAAYFIAGKKTIVFNVFGHLSAPGEEIIFNVKATGYRKPQFRYWAKEGSEFILLKDWCPESSFTLPKEFAHVGDIGVHVRSGGKGDWVDQAWIKNERWK